MSSEWLPITLVDVDFLIHAHYPDRIGVYQETRNERGYFIGSLTTFDNDTSRLRIKNIAGQGLFYQELPLDIPCAS